MLVVNQHVYSIPVSGADRLSVKRFNVNNSGVPVILIHGSVENGKIFYSSSGRGLAPFLAKEGFDVYVVDLRGKGQSTPKISSKTKISQMDAIAGDIPAVLDLVRTESGDQPVHLGAHSWGGVLLLAWFARFHSTRQVRSMVFFGTKRKIYIRTLKKFFMVDLMWNWVGRLVSFFVGYLPAVKLKFGSDNEPRRFFLDVNRWVFRTRWIDREDGMDYKKVLPGLKLPPVFSLTGVNDDVLGHPHDVKKLLEETGADNYRYQVVGKKYGNLHDYDHINLLTHPDAPADHFQEVLKWLREH